MLNLRDPALATPGPSAPETSAGTGEGRVSTLVHVSADRALWTGIAVDDPDYASGAPLSLLARARNADNRGRPTDCGGDIELFTRPSSTHPPWPSGASEPCA